MNHSAMSIFLLLSFTAFLVSAKNVGKPVQGLDLKTYNEEQVRGCYHYSETLGICFDIQQHTLKLLKTTGENIFVDHDFYPGSFLYQVLDEAFIGVDESMVYVPKDIPRHRDELLAFLALKKESLTEQQKTEELQSTKAHYDEAMSELHDIPEIQLLELVQEALMENGTQLEILKPFYTLCVHLLTSANVQTPAELTAAHDYHTRQKRCTDVRDYGRHNNCRGMCGPKCWCWSYWCGDCCWHQGCYEHDLCCGAKGYYHEYCRRPFKHGWSCSRYPIYPRCLY